MRIEFGDDAIFVVNRIMDGLRAKGLTDQVGHLELAIGEFSIEINELLTKIHKEAEGGSDEGVARLLGFKSASEIHDLFKPFRPFGFPFGPYSGNFQIRRRLSKNRGPDWHLFPELSPGEFTRIVVDSLFDGENYKTVIPVNVILAINLMFNVSVLPLRCYRATENIFRQLERNDGFVFVNDEPTADVDNSQFVDMDLAADSFGILFKTSDSRWDLIATARILPSEQMNTSRSLRDSLETEGMPIDFLLPSLRELYRPFVNIVQLISREVEQG